MRLVHASLYAAVTAAVTVFAQTTAGIQDLVNRCLPRHADSFTFSLVNASEPLKSQNDAYTVSTTKNGKILVEGNSLSALAVGLRRYLTDVAHVDIYWYTGNQLDLAPGNLPKLAAPLTGTSAVPWRYHFNTVTFSYTTAFWTWDEWETQLDWMALHGVNLPLAWVGAEKILVEVFREIGLTDDEILSFLSGPAFQAWNRFANIQGSWGGSLPFDWIDEQFELQKEIVKRMVELGMTPVLPSFTGFVPRAITRVSPNAAVVNGSRWISFPTIYTNDTFLEPLDPLFTQLQKSFITKQIEAYGNISNIYTLDQYNENDPYSGDLDYLRNVTYNTWKSLKSANPAAIWLMQGWLFFSSSAFWTNERIEAYLSGIENNEDALILDLFSESQPQWQRTNSYYGKPWIWCELHDYGGNMGLYGQVMNITVDAVEALKASPSLLGFGLTMEGQEGNEIVYDLLLDQAWSTSPIDTKSYFDHWVTSRYTGESIPEEIYSAWDILRTTVFNNTQLNSATAVTKSIFELAPSIQGLVGRTGHHPTTVNYDPTYLVRAWNLMYNASKVENSLWRHPSFQYDMVDFTRQVLSNAFIPLYQNLVSAYTNQTLHGDALSESGRTLLELLSAIDEVLLTNEHFLLSSWLADARSSADCSCDHDPANADFFEYNARNQITLWGPSGQINDYASKSWAGLVSSYYVPRWQIFIDYIASTNYGSYNATTLNTLLLKFSLGWQTEKWGEKPGEAYGTVGDLDDVVKKVYSDWESVFK
ncbi:glycoside hydrolase family 89 protein [Amanita muscaria Koide BX008]|uniref:Glycoside hydrolase family 89 protein n=1 Tax=Amanita muscaria (strain Koide BX008) TaxID=946122 RepID=A0A0C2S859_AMAMK|nr:glycoside hydrolase family 89 protein [Amanita muscaria Koide BX008]